MIDLDTSHLPQEVAYLFMLRGAEPPTLQWQERANDTAKKALDAMDDTKLFGREQLADEGMAAAVRGLLYLWNGWPNDCKMISAIAPANERHYLAGLCARHTGQSAKAKTEFQMLDGHPIYEPLAQYVVGAIGAHDNPALTRFKAVIELDPVWEPFMFADLYEQARAGKLCPASEQTVRKLQFKEFELLFVHCYEKATGQELVCAHQKTARPTPKPKPVRASSKKRRHATPTPTEKSSESPKDWSGLLAPPVKVRCPKCSTIMKVPGSMCGDVVKCLKCGAFLAVPKRDRAAPSAKARS